MTRPRSLTARRPLRRLSRVLDQVRGYTGSSSLPASVSPSLPLRLEPLECRRMLTITVDTLVDEADGSIVDGDVSLRDALALASPGETIDFAVTGTIDLTLGELLIDRPLRVRGPGAALLTIDASGSDAAPGVDQGDGVRVFHVDDGDAGTNANVVIEGLTLTGGDVTGAGGAILSHESLTLRDSTITGNAATTRGGGVYAYGAGGATTVIENNQIFDNTADHGGGIFVFSNTGADTTIRYNAVSYNVAQATGGNIRTNTTAASSVTISDNTIEHGTASTGGGLFAFTSVTSSTAISGNGIGNNYATLDGGGAFIHTVSGSTTNVDDSDFSGNDAGRDGAGIYTITSGAGSSLDIATSTLSGNVTEGDGGGLYAYTYNGASTTITDSTISNNRANDDGGALRGFTATGGQLLISNSTIADNSTADRGGLRLFTYSGGMTEITSSTITGNTKDGESYGGLTGAGINTTGSVDLVLHNTIVAGNKQLAGTLDDLAGRVSAASSYNIVGVNLGLVGISDGANGNRVGTPAVPINPLLGPLADNGGPTQTRLPLPGSPAINSGDPAFTAPPDFDQRGASFARVYDGVVDVGAVEVQAFTPLALVVDTMADENDGDYSAGDLSLREAIALANANPSADGITFDVALDGGTILLSLGELAITDSVTIDASSLASGLTVDASGNDPTPDEDNGDGSRVLNVNDHAQDNQIDVAIVGLTLTGGDVDGDGGGILSFENLSVSDATISGNSADNGGGIWAISNDGLVAIDNSSISGNAARVSGGAISAITFGTSTTISDSTISDNTAGDTGGGVYTRTYAGGDTTITRSTISGNTAGTPTEYGNGGGIAALSFSSSTTISDSTIDHNTAHADGGGLHTRAFDGTVDIVQSTVSGNTADGDGGGVYSYTYSSGATSIRYSTIAQNTADADQADGGSGGGVALVGPTAPTVSLTIVATNTVGDGSADDVTGAVDTASGFNLIGVNTGLSGINNGVSGNQVGTGAIPIEPLLGPLANNGGPTKTHALYGGSPAINAGDMTIVGQPDFDQRGSSFERVVGESIDIGAFEVQDFYPISLVVDNADDESDGDYSMGDLSLREAIELTNANPAADTITFDAGLDGATILLTMGELAITDSLVIDASSLASGLTIDASGNDPTPAMDNGDGSRVFHISDSGPFNDNQVELRGLTLTGGDVGSGGGAIFSATGLTLVDSTITGNAADFGGGINAVVYSGAPLVIAGSTISGNTAGSYGGGLYTRTLSGQTTITDSRVDGNSATNGGGIYSRTLSGTTTISGCLVENNAAMYGGGLYVRTLSGGTTITTTTVTGNTSEFEGGGMIVWTSDDLTQISDSTINDNHAQRDGGGIWIGTDGGVSEIVNSTISGNTSDSYGGGVYLHTLTDGAATVRHTTITANVANADNSYGGTGGGLYGFGSGTNTISHVIVAGNTEGDGSADDVHAALEPESAYNLIGADPGLNGITNGVNGNIVGTLAVPIDAMLTPLADNGGLTMTHALLPGSPALDAGDPAALSGVGDVPAADQRGGLFVRVGLASIDIGAYEQQPTVIYPGDGNLDGYVDYDDLEILFMHWGDNPAADPPGAPRNGDFNYDGVVDRYDYFEWNANYGAGPDSAEQVAVAAVHAQEELSVAAVASKELTTVAVESAPHLDWAVYRAFDAVLEQLDDE